MLSVSKGLEQYRICSGRLHFRGWECFSGELSELCNAMSAILFLISNFAQGGDPLYSERSHLTHLSAYNTHKNIGVCKIMEAMCAEYAKSRTQWKHALKIWNVSLRFSIPLCWYAFPNFSIWICYPLACSTQTLQKLVRPLDTTLLLVENQTSVQ